MALSIPISTGVLAYIGTFGRCAQTELLDLSKKLMNMFGCLICKEEIQVRSLQLPSDEDFFKGRKDGVSCGA